MPAILKNNDFSLVSEFVTLDAKKRLRLSAAGELSNAFNVYRNKLGQIVLDPVKAIPVSETWLWENPGALASVQRGLQQANKDETHDLGDFSRYAKE
jgi:hypothetical protein